MELSPNMAKRKLRDARAQVSTIEANSKDRGGGPFEDLIRELRTSLSRNKFVQ